MDTNTTTIRNEIVNAVIEKVNAIKKPCNNSDNNGGGAFLDNQVVNDIDEYNRFLQKIVFDNESLIKDEKTYLTNELNINYEYFERKYHRFLKPQFCDKCKRECMAQIYCTNCIRNYLKTKFSTWTSGNKEIDNLIQKCQMETQGIYVTIEWVPYDQFRDIEYLTKGGCSEIYEAEWIDGPYSFWHIDEQEFKRVGSLKVILKKLNDVENAKRTWWEEAISHMSIANKYSGITDCFGLTQDPSSGVYFLIILKMDADLRTYLRHNHNKIKWEERIKITKCIIDAVFKIHHENAIHRDLHSGNVLKTGNNWMVNDLGLCGPANKPLGGIYGNLPYIAPEIIHGSKQTYASDIYSIGILMWEILSGRPPFSNDNYGYELALKIVNGMRPKKILGTPVEYSKLMQQCWEADPRKRPDIYALRYKFAQFRESFVPNEDNDQIITNETPKELNIVHTSKIYYFNNIPEPRNAKEEDIYENANIHSYDNHEFLIPEVNYSDDDEDSDDE